MNRLFLIVVLLFVSITGGFATIGPILSDLLSTDYNNGNSQDLVIVGNKAYVADGANGIACFQSFPDLYAKTPLCASTLSNGFVSKIKVVGNYLYAVEGMAGLSVYGITNTGLEFKQRYLDFGNVSDMLVVDDIVYIGSGVGLRALQLSSNKTTASVLWDIPVSASKFTISEDGQFLYVAQNTQGLRGFDISDPSTPVEIVHLSGTALSIQEVHIKENTLLAVAWSDGLKRFTIGSDGNLTDEVTVSLGGMVSYARRAKLDGDFLYVGSYGDNEVKIVELSDLSKPRYIGSINGFATGEAVTNGFVRQGNILHITTGTGKIRRANISQPYGPVRVAGIDVSNNLKGGDANGSHLFMADLQAGLLVFDIQDPLDPVHLSTTPMLSGYAWDATVFGNTAYVANGANGVAVFNTTNPTNPVFLRTVKPVSSLVNHTKLSIDREKGLLFAANAKGGVVSYRLDFPTQPLPISIKPPKNSNGVVESVYADGDGVLYSAEGPSRNTVSYLYDENGTLSNASGTEVGDTGGTHDVTIVRDGNFKIPVYAHDGIGKEYYFDVNLSIPAIDSPVGLSSAGFFLLGSTYSKGLEINDIYRVFEPNRPSKIIPMPAYGSSLAGRAVVSGDYAYLPDKIHGVHVISIAPLTHLEEVSRSVEQNGTLYSLNEPVLIEFNKLFNTVNIDGLVEVWKNGFLVACDIETNGKQLSIIPISGGWNAGAEYHIFISGYLVDIYGNHLGENLPDGQIEWIFYTAP